MDQSRRAGSGFAAARRRAGESSRTSSHCVTLSGLSRSVAKLPMEEDRTLSLLALLEWEERWERWNKVRAADRARLVRELARVMMRMGAREGDDERDEARGPASRASGGDLCAAVDT